MTEPNLPAFAQSSLPKPPCADPRPVSTTLFGDTRVDAYGWLRDPGYPEVKDPAILDHLRAENAYAEAALTLGGDVRPALFEEMKARIVAEDRQVPYRHRGHAYFWRFEAGGEHRLHCRRSLNGGDEQILLDVNQRAASFPFYQVPSLRVSPDDRLIAFAEDIDGSERYRLRLKDMATGALLDEMVTDAAPGLVWAADAGSFFYTKLDAQLRPREVRRHVIGTAQDQDMLVYEETDPTYWLFIGRSLTERFLYIISSAKTSTEFRYVPLDQADAAPIVVVPRRADHEYDLVDRGEHFLIRTNDRHRNFRIVEAPISDPAETNWVERVAPSDDRYLIDLVAAKDWWAVFERVRGLTSVRVFDADGDHLVSFPDVVYAVGAGDMAEADLPALRLSYQSPVTPSTVFDYHVASRQLETLKQTKVPTYDPGRYQVERRWAVVRDGVEVPVTIISGRHAPRDGSAPLLLYGYGAYGAGMEPDFNAQRFSLIDRGMVWAIVHIRGGDELGHAWYEAGKFERKQNSFNDFIDVAQDLVAAGYTARGKIAALGGSAGGLLVGAAVNQAPPGLFGAALAIVPFVDALNTMLDASLPLTPPEYNEWGNPQEERFYRAIRAYSPYDNVSAKDYPHLFVSAGLNDPRVTYWEPAKWVAKLRATKTDNQVVVLKTNMESGHGGASGRYQRLKETAEEYSFILKALGIDAATGECDVR